MMRVSALVLLAKLSLSAAAEGSFSYDRTAANGPYSWSKLSKDTECDAATDEQSPRDLCGAKSTELELGAQDSWKYTGDLVVHNNGHTIQVNFDQKNPPTTINKLAEKVGRGAFDSDQQTWNVAQVHFHWTTYEGYGGSEHTLAGDHYPMEAHFVHYNAKYGSLGGAVASGKKDALFVIGLFLNWSEKESGFISSIGNAIKTATRKPMKYTYDAADFTKFAEANILAKGARFYNYAGGLTTPTCNEIVTWVVMEQTCMITKATMKKFQDASTNPAGRRLQAYGESMAISESEFEGQVLSLTSYPIGYQITQANVQGFLEAIKRRKLADDTIGKFGNYRPISLNKNPVYYSNPDKPGKGSAKCTKTYADGKMMQASAKICPKFISFAVINCNDGKDKPCRRDPTELEFAAMCAEVLFDPKCSKDTNPHVVAFKDFCPQYKWRVNYPSCTRGYWDSGCGQPAMKQKATDVRCYGTVKSPSLFVFEAPDACTGPKPAAVDRVCPATPECPRCKGCKRNGDCFKTCGNKEGLCSACDSRDGTLGACCKQGAKDSPIVCKYMAQYPFASTSVHTCATLIEDTHTGYVIYDILKRLHYAEGYIDHLEAKRLEAKK